MNRQKTREHLMQKFINKRVFCFTTLPFHSLSFNNYFIDFFRIRENHEQQTSTRLLNFFLEHIALLPAKLWKTYGKTKKVQ